MSLEIKKGTELQGRYVFSDVLGSGGYATVWKATDKKLSRDVAIKRLLNVKGNDLAQLLAEAKITAGLNHTNIVQVYGTFVEDEEGFLVTEYVDGQTLNTLLQQHIASGSWLSSTDAAEYFGQILEALSFAHSKGHYHRDVKPSNLLVSRLDVVKLVDLGIARAIAPMGPPQDSPYGNGAAHTGTPEFMSPEQAKGETLDQQTDIFSAGIVGCILFTGQHPFNHPSALHRVFDLIRAEGYDPKDPRVVNAAVPERIAKIIARMLKKKKTERYASVSEALADFRPREAAKPCPKCGTPNPETGKFCGECGQQLETAKGAGTTLSAASLTEEGFSLAQADDWAGAGMKYRQAIALDSNYIRASSNLGYALNRLGRYEEAIEVLDLGLKRGAN
jgi:serine/threonine protein kinase